MSISEFVQIVPSGAGLVAVDVTLSNGHNFRTYSCRVTAFGDAYSYSVRCTMFSDHQASGTAFSLPSALETAMEAARSLFRENAS